MDKDLVDQVVSAAQRVVASGAISANGHGNVSIRVPGAEEMYYTAAPSLRDHPASAVVRVGLDGTLPPGGTSPGMMNPLRSQPSPLLVTSMGARRPASAWGWPVHSSGLTGSLVSDRLLSC